MSDKSIGLAIGAGIVIAGVIFVVSRKAKAAEETPTPGPEVTFDSVSELKADILSASDFTELNGYYNQIGGLLNIGQISLAEYDELYTAYVRRFYQLTGVNE